VNNFSFIFQPLSVDGSTQLSRQGRVKLLSTVDSAVGSKKFNCPKTTALSLAKKALSFFWPLNFLLPTALSNSSRSRFQPAHYNDTEALYVETKVSDIHPQ